MANEVIFVTEARLKEFTVLNDNIDMKVLQPVIRMCQDIHIQPIIGSGLYNELKSQVYSGTLTALNKTLLDDYLINALVWFVLSESPLVLNYKFENKSVVKKNSENSQTADMFEIEKLMNNFRNKAEFYAERMSNYLRQYSNSYPLYLSTTGGWDVIRPNTHNYTSGIFLGKRNKVNRNQSRFRDGNKPWL